MAFTVNKKAFCVLEFAKTESIVTMQRRFRIIYHTEPPTDKTILEWYMKFQQSGCLCAAKWTGRPDLSAETLEGVRETFVRNPQKSPRMHISSTCKVGQKLGVSLSLSLCWYAPFCRVCLVVGQSSSEIPEGLTNNPVYGKLLSCQWRS